MRKITKIMLSAILVLAVAVGCQKENVKPTENPNANETKIDRETIALNVLKIMQKEEAREAILEAVSKNKVAVSLESVMDNQTVFSSNANATKVLSAILDKSKETTLGKKSVKVEIPELWILNPKENIAASELLISFPPKGDEKEWKEVVAYKLDGTKVILDPMVEPTETVLVVETSGYEALKAEVDLMNAELRRAGLQSDKMKELNFGAAGSDLETTKLNEIRLNNDQEPWISGAAEIYAVTSGLRVSDVQNEKYASEISVIPFYYLDEDGKTYYPNQVILFWDDYDYKAANIQLFEKDSGHNYKELVSAITESVSDLVAAFTGHAWVTLLGDVASAIINATPDHWYTNDDDYVDSFYTIEKNRTYTNHRGAAGNAKVTLVPYLLEANN